MKKSYARIKFLGCLFISWGAAAGIAIGKIPLVDDIFFVVFMFFAFLSASVRCENCKTLLYRRNSKEHGFPNIMLLFPDMKCPVCGSQRH